jgi:hypothetical protein
MTGSWPFAVNRAVRRLWPLMVESECGAVAGGRTYLLPPLSPFRLAVPHCFTLALSPIRDNANRRLQPFCYLNDCSDCFRLERIAGWGLHPLDSAALSRRTPIAVILPTPPGVPHVGFKAAVRLLPIAARGLQLTGLCPDPGATPISAITIVTLWASMDLVSVGSIVSPQKSLMVGGVWRLRPRLIISAEPRPLFSNAPMIAGSH